MGNSASNPANGRPLHQRRTQSPSPAPGAPHRSLRAKKKSLELPDLASLSLTSPPHRQQKTASIPIPSAAADAQRERGRVVPPPFSSTDSLDTQPYPRHEQPAPAPSAPPGRGTPYYRTQQQQQVQQRRIQELYNQANVPAEPPESRGSSPVFVQEVVRSSIPVALQPKPRVLEGSGGIAGGPGVSPDPVPVKIVWHGGGSHVLLARAGDDEWKGRRAMDRETLGSSVFVTTVNLLPGTHHIRFLVDDQWRVADDLPTAVDDQGSLANYVAVPVAIKGKDPSFFSESTTNVAAMVPAATSAVAAAATAASSSQQPPTRQGPNPAQRAQWTNVLPPELLEAFKEEEMYLAANQGQVDPQNHHHRVSGFVPAPNIPPAPGLPRHLDKLILNMRVSPGPALAAVGNVGPVGNAASVVQSGQVGSGQGGRSARRDRTREEKKEERRRGRERGYSDVTGGPRRMPPPPPPPSEVGEVDPAVDEGYSPRTPGGAAWPESASASTSEPSTTVTTAATSPAMPSTPIVLSNSVPNPTVLGGNATLPPSRTTLTIDTTNMPPLTDDGSVLPVPSHVVLHHLCTSAIRNGVLAVGNTTRYKKKYLTTIYYKPT